MNKSFEDKIRERLGEYRVDPPIGFRDAILNTPGPGEVWLIRFFHVFGAVLMLISLFMVGYIPMRGEADLVRAEPSLNSQEIQDFSENSFSESVITHAMGDEKMTPKIVSSNAPNPKDELITSLTSEDVKGEKNHYTHIQRGYDSWGLDKLAGEKAQESTFPMLLGGFKKEDIVFKREKSTFTTYFEGGAFFLYNRIKPNLDDEIYVSDYDAPFGLAASRIGLSLHWGLQRVWSERFTTRLGLGFNHYNQDFSFNVRSTTPNAVVVESDFVTPVYEITAVQIQKRVATLGGRVQNIWSFPSRYNSLFTSFEYQRIISSLPTFEYEGEKHTLVNPNQYLLELGLRKMLFEGNRGIIYVTPALKYSVTKLRNLDIVAVKPFSVGVSISYGLK